MFSLEAQSILNNPISQQRTLLETHRFICRKPRCTLQDKRILARDAAVLYDKNTLCGGSESTAAR